LRIFMILIVMFLFFYFFGEYLLWKVPQYMRALEFSSIWQSTLFMLMTLVYVKNKKHIVLFFIPIIVASLIVGPERMVIIAYFVFVYHAIQYKRGLNYGIGLTMLYFGVKTFGFLYNILNTGQGFSDGIPEL
jgi:hypothetical protein